jgi:DNA-binding NarL/FixJ family response regulator
MAKASAFIQPSALQTGAQSVGFFTAELQTSGQLFEAPVSHSSSTLPWPPFLVGQVSRPVRVVLVDDDSSIRNVISNELMTDRRCDLVGQAGSMREGRRLISSCEFEVMLVDLNLGDGNGFELIEHLKTVRPMAEAIVISAMEDEQHALHAFELGATGYLVKNSWFGNFSQAVLQVVNGGASITPNLARRLLHRLDHTQSDTAHRAEPHKKALSEREHAILKMVAVGYTSTEIGSRLTISGLTVNTHIKNIYRKLQVKTRAHAVSSALQRGLL